MNTKRKFMKTLLGLSFIATAGLLSSCQNGSGGQITTSLSSDWGQGLNLTRCGGYAITAVVGMDHAINRTAPAFGNLQQLGYTTGNSNLVGFSPTSATGRPIFNRVMALLPSGFTNGETLRNVFRKIGYNSAADGWRTVNEMPRVGDIVLTTAAGVAGHWVTIVNVPAGATINQGVIDGVRFYTSLGTPGIYQGRVTLRSPSNNGRTPFVRPNSGFRMPNNAL